ncbi:sodium/potassium/calcium exchanger 4 [Octopus bimaculoides]|nr:sodium/potassium/calcium exchanger 4 [Octopus bimaculoides]|eukprot:XP_014771268.1 PREDICTED: sodium/potassium/calcium exchanger 4-like [Octopus bimaculoides]
MALNDSVKTMLPSFDISTSHQVRLEDSAVNLTAHHLNTTTSTTTSTTSIATSAIIALTNSTLLPLISSTVTHLRTSTLFENITSVPAYLCSSPAYKEFPPDLFTNEQRYHGAMVLHFILGLYMFYALSIVCDEYLYAVLEKTCQTLGFGEDVAGATFMAAGSSAPELFTSIIGVFVTKGDVGVGTIVGSAVFNILFVIGLCGLVTMQAVSLSWWPLCRDSIYYSFAVVILVLVVLDGVVTWYESLIMLILYAVYIILMRFNTVVQSYVSSKLRRGESTELLHTGGTAMKSLGKGFGDYEMFNNDEEDVYSRDSAPAQPPVTTKPPEQLPVDEYLVKYYIPYGFYGFIFRLLMMNRFSIRTRFISAVRLVIIYRRKMNVILAAQRRQDFKSAAQQPSVTSYSKTPRSWVTTYDTEQVEQWKTMPSINTDGILAIVKWVIAYPIQFALYYTIPDCRKPRFQQYFIATFLTSILWIAIFSYLMVWMVTLIGFTLKIPDSVMGITFLAAGTSIPDAMASVYVVRQGMGDMAVSNSIGSNVFDILLGLALPWFIQTALVDPGSYVHINSNGMVYSILLLFITVIATVSAIRKAGWYLNRYVGIACLVTYAIYLVLSVMIECNVLGFVNLPMCTE